MKNLSFEKMEKIDGGDLTGAMCYAGALSSLGDTAPGSAEWYILTNLYVDSFPMCAQYLL